MRGIDAGAMVALALFGVNVLGADSPPGTTDPGVKALEQKRYADAVKIYTGNIERYGPRESFYSDRGNAYMGLKQADKALEDFKIALHLNQSYVCYLNLGHAYCVLGDFTDAISNLDEAIRLKPDSAVAYAARGMARIMNDQMDLADEDFKQAVKLHGRLEPIIRKLLKLMPEARASDEGYKFFRKKEYPSAIASLDKAISFDPKFGAAYRLRGNAHLKLGEYGPALTDFHRALQLNSRDLQTDNDLAWLLATCPDAKYRNGPEGLRDVKEAYGLKNKNWTFALDTRAAVYAELGQFKDAQNWERRYLNSSGLTSRQKADGEARLELYQEGKPFRENLPVSLHD